eukprot:3018709-Prymnesium_polylepis.1
MSDFLQEHKMLSVEADQCGKGWDNDVRKPTDYRFTTEMEAMARSECGTNDQGVHPRQARRLH